jgi:hypothetical protein
MRSFWIDFIHYCRKVLLWVLPPLRTDREVLDVASYTVTASQIF